MFQYCQRANVTCKQIQHSQHCDPSQQSNCQFQPTDQLSNFLKTKDTGHVCLFLCRAYMQCISEASFSASAIYRLIMLQLLHLTRSGVPRCARPIQQALPCLAGQSALEVVNCQLPSWCSLPILAAA